MAKSSTILTGAKARVFLNGRRLGGATNLTLKVDAKSVATAMVKFFELERRDEKRRIKMVDTARGPVPMTHELNCYVKKIEQAKDGRTEFHLVAVHPKWASKKDEKFLMDLIKRCTSEPEHATEQVSVA
jgi:hypothetical protein